MPRRRAQNTRPQMFLPSKRLFSDQVPHGLRSSSCITVLKITLRHNYWRKVRTLSKISQKNYKENRAKLLAKLTSLRISSFSALTILLRSSLTSISSWISLLLSSRACFTLQNVWTLITSNLDSLWESKKWFRDDSSSIKRKCMFLYKAKNVYYAPSEYWNAGTVYPITISSLYINKSGN